MWVTTAEAFLTRAKEFLAIYFPDLEGPTRDDHLTAATTPKSPHNIRLRALCALCGETLLPLPPPAA